MKDIYPNIQSAALVLECTEGSGRLWCSFSEANWNACSYRGELLGLMAVHLILLLVNEVCPNLTGLVHIFSDCLGALDMVKNLPPNKIPTSCAHSDILKNILVNCNCLTFTTTFSHVRAHQDNRIEYHHLPRLAQLNCAMDFHAKKVLWDMSPLEEPKPRPLPLEPVCLFHQGVKIASNMSDYLRFVTHRKLAKLRFYDLKILVRGEFDRIDWEAVYQILCEVPKLFQLWACKQVMGIAGTKEWDKSEVSKCPSCTIARDTCGHVLFCDNVGRVETLKHTINLMESWLEDANTDPDLLDCIAEYAHGRGGRSMLEICTGLGEEYTIMAREQDEIGWRRFTEGMISRQMRQIQLKHHMHYGTRVTPIRWAKGLVLKLLEATHGQWLYRNVQIHDEVSETLATIRKEDIQRQIEEQMELGAAGLLEEDHWMMEVNLDPEASSGEREEYWLLAIKATRQAAYLVGQQNPTTQREEPQETGN